MGSIAKEQQASIGLYPKGFKALHKMTRDKQSSNLFLAANKQVRTKFKTSCVALQFYINKEMLIVLNIR